MHLFLDIEALGLRPGAAITEIGAVEFDPHTGRTGPREFHARLQVLPTDIVDPDTLAWHQKQGTYPHPAGATAFLPSLALFDFMDWVFSFGHDLQAVWSWGATYDFPLLESAFHAHLSRGLPWHYAKSQCARTLWNCAFPGTKHAPRPHHALQDCHLSVADLAAALQHLRTPAISSPDH